MTAKRFSMFGDMTNIKQWVLDRKDNSRMSSKWEMLDKLNELAEENEQLQKSLLASVEKNRKLQTILDKLGYIYVGDLK